MAKEKAGEMLEQLKEPASNGHLKKLSTDYSEAKTNYAMCAAKVMKPTYLEKAKAQEAEEAEAAAAATE